LSHFSADILGLGGEFQVVTCNLAVHSQGLLSADKAAISPGSADACSSKEPLKPLFSHLICYLFLSQFLFSLGGGRKRMQGNSVCMRISKIFWIPSKSTTAPKRCSRQLHYGMGQKLTINHTDPSSGICCLLYSRSWTPRSCRTLHTLPILSPSKN